MHTFQNQNRIFSEDTFGFVPAHPEPDTPTFNPFLAQSFLSPLRTPFSAHPQSRWDKDFELFDRLQLQAAQKVEKEVYNKEMQQKEMEEQTDKERKGRGRLKKVKCVVKVARLQKNKRGKILSKCGDKKSDSKQLKISMFLRSKSTSLQS